MRFLKHSREEHYDAYRKHNNGRMWNVGLLGDCTVAQQRLRTSAYRPLRDVQCEERANTVVLRGQVSSFYYKQRAQEVVRKTDDACRIVNELEVEDRPR